MFDTTLDADAETCDLLIEGAVTRHALVKPWNRLDSEPYETPQHEARAYLAALQRAGVPEHLIHDCRSLDDMKTLWGRRRSLPGWEREDPADAPTMYDDFHCAHNHDVDSEDDR